MISLNHYDAWCDSPLERDQILSLAYALSMACSLTDNGQDDDDLAGLMRVAGVPVPHEYVPLVTAVSKQGVSAIPSEERESIEPHLPEELASVRLQANRVSELVKLLKSEVGSWEEGLDGKAACCDGLSSDVSRLALGYVFCLFEIAEGNKAPRGDTLEGCIRDAGLEVNNNNNVQLLTQLAQQGAKAVPKEIRLAFCKCVLNSIDRVEVRWVEIDARALELLDIIGVEGVTHN